MNKPRKSFCKKYCKDYATCTLTECNRTKGWRNGGPIEMLDVEVAKELDNKMKWRIYNTQRELLENGNAFRRPKIGRVSIR